MAQEIPGRSVDAVTGKATRLKLGPWRSVQTREALTPPSVKRHKPDSWPEQLPIAQATLQPMSEKLAWRSSARSSSYLSAMDALRQSLGPRLRELERLTRSGNVEPAVLRAKWADAFGKSAETCANATSCPCGGSRRLKWNPHGVPFIACSNYGSTGCRNNVARSEFFKFLGINV